MHAVSTDPDSLTIVLNVNMIFMSDVRLSRRPWSGKITNTHSLFSTIHHAKAVRTVRCSYVMFVKKICRRIYGFIIAKNVIMGRMCILARFMKTMSQIIEEEKKEKR
uniref:Uncharacterized protein At2g44390/F4I1.20 n=1 Tax=Arabidopsis thaliana TaxID=3702 RepID=Q84WY6_ARATH|nr:hypothetical protein [Arabidopsis thaliana]AAT69140.1 hypothetical protein At2g44390 [Arabidopsis thaliana]